MNQLLVVKIFVYLDQCLPFPAARPDEASANGGSGRRRVVEKHSRQGRFAEAICVALGWHEEVEVRSRFLELWWNVVELTVLDLQRRIRGGLEGRVHDIGQSWKVRSPWIVGGKALVL